MSNYDRRPPPAYEQIRVLEDMNAKLEEENAKLREAAQAVVLYVHDELHQEELDALQAALKQEEGNSG